MKVYFLLKLINFRWNNVLRPKKWKHKIKRKKWEIYKHAIGNTSFLTEYKNSEAIVVSLDKI